MSLDEELQDWAKATEQPAPTSGEVQALVERASARGRRASPLGWMTITALGGSVLTAAAVAAVWFAVQPQSVGPAPPTVVEAAPPRTIAPPAIEPERLTEGVHLRGADRVEVFEQSLVVVEEDDNGVTYALEEGGIAIRAAPRELGSSLSVAHGDWIVRVVGTQFSVEDEPFTVRVTEGVVRVMGPDTDATLRAGDRLVDGRITRAPVIRQTPPLPQISGLKQLLLDGDVASARAGLTERLDADPSDVQSWTLLAQLESRSGDARAATVAWRQVVTRGAPAEAQRARFEAARLSEDRPEEVVELLTPFMVSPGALAPEAGLRLGRALAALGRRDEARERLQQVVEAHPGTAAAREAAVLLREL